MNDSIESNPQGSRAAPGAWLLLIHQVPPKPDYLRVKVRRRLHRIGAVPIKASVYVLPATAEAREDLEWLRREIVEMGGEALLCEARLLNGLSDADVEELFRRDRDARFEELAAEARAWLEAGDAGEPGREGAGLLDRLEGRLAEVRGIDYFGAPARAAAEHALERVRTRVKGGTVREEGKVRRSEVGPGATWVTRRGIYVDRIASAWLIRRFIDPEASFRFVAEGYAPAPGELRFDMFEGEFSHEGERCTFETLLSAFGLDDPALAVVAEIVHDLDCKDEKFGRPEAMGVGALVRGLVGRHPSDEARLEEGMRLMDQLHASFAGGEGQ